MFECVLFDLDGTLIDSAPDLGAAANRLRQDEGLPDLPLEHYRHMAGAGARGMIGLSLGIKPDDAAFADLRERFFCHYEADLTTRTVVFDGVSEVLQTLTAMGMPWGVVTNKMARFSEPISRQLPLFDGCGVLISGDTTPHAKPHPEPLLEAARRMQVSPETCLYVGDDLRDMQAAKAAGMQGAVAAYGYLGEAGDPSHWGAEFLLETPQALLKLLKSA